MVAGVGVHDVDRLDRVEEVLLGVGAEDVGHAGVEARAEEGGEAGLLEALAVGPLPGVLELGEVGRLVVGRVDVVDAGVEAGVHQVEVLVGQGEIDQQVGAERLDQGDGGLDVVRVDGRGLDRAARGGLDVGGDGLALVLVARSQHDFREGLGVHGALVGDDVADAAGADDQDFLAHG